MSSRRRRSARPLTARRATARDANGRASRALLPVWARRAHQLRAELRGERFPPTADAGVRMVADLSAACLNDFAGSLRGRPLARVLAQMAAADHARRPLWKLRRGWSLGR